MIPQLSRLLALGGVLVILGGCDGGPELSPVSGRVTVNDKPLVNAAIIFSPLDEGMPQVTSGGTTDSNGDYELSTPKGQPGAVVGKHKVMIKPAKRVDSSLASANSEYDPIIEGEAPDYDTFEFEIDTAEDGDLAAARLGVQTFELDVPQGGTNTANFAITAK